MSQNLEDIEQKALSYLRQVSNPLVRLGVLYAHLEEELSTAGITVSDFRTFLENHELFRVIEPLELPDGGETTGDAAEDLSQPYVILDTRVPTEQQMSLMMLDQLNSLQEALTNAFTEAQGVADVPRMNTIQEALNRIEPLRKRLTAHERQN